MDSFLHGSAMQHRRKRELIVPSAHDHACLLELRSMRCSAAAWYTARKVQGAVVVALLVLLVVVLTGETPTTRQAGQSRAVRRGFAGAVPCQRPHRAVLVAAYSLIPPCLAGPRPKVRDGLLGDVSADAAAASSKSAGHNDAARSDAVGTAGGGTTGSLVQVDFYGRAGRSSAGPGPARPQVLLDKRALQAVCLPMQRPDSPALHTPAASACRRVAVPRLPAHGARRAAAAVRQQGGRPHAPDVSAASGAPAAGTAGHGRSTAAAGLTSRALPVGSAAAAAVCLACLPSVQAPKAQLDAETVAANTPLLPPGPKLCACSYHAFGNVKNGSDGEFSYQHGPSELGPHALQPLFTLLAAAVSAAHGRHWTQPSLCCVLVPQTKASTTGTSCAASTSTKTSVNGGCPRHACVPPPRGLRLPFSSVEATDPSPCPRS